MLDRRVALKVLDRSVTAAGDFEHRFRLEARTIAGLNHPNIVQIHSLEKIGDDLAIDMPFIEGGSLADNDRIHRMPAPELLNIARDVLLGLACCHESGIIHRDVKPSNILLTGDGRGLLTDFGLAKLLSAYQSASINSVSSSSFFLGTPRYAPPEAWDGNEPAPAWDVYSLGLILFEGFSGSVVYDAQTPLSLMKQMLERPVPRLDDVIPGVSKELADLLALMLQRNATLRPRDAGDVLESLLRLPEMRGGDDRSVAIPKPPRRRRSRRKTTRPPGERRSWWSWGAPATLAFTVAALLISVGWFVLRPKQEELAGNQRQLAISVPETVISEAYGVFDTVEPLTQTAWTANLLMLNPEGASEQDFLAYTATSVWYGSVQAHSGAATTIGGYWAEYADESARIFRHGTFSGSGNWLRPASALAVSATFVCTQDGSRTARAFIVNSSEQPPSFAALIRAMESAPGVQALLYNELAPRQMPWIGFVENKFLRPLSPIVRVPMLDMANAAPALDGRLDDKVWQDAFRRAALFGGAAADNGIAICTSRPALAQMALCYSNSGLNIGIQLDVPVTECLLSLSLSEHPAVPISHAPRRFAQFHGPEMQASYLEEFGVHTNWMCDWQVSCAEVSGKTQIECFLPFASLEARDWPALGTRWRLAATVSDAAVPDGGPVAVWGTGDMRAVEHGVLLAFGQ